MAEITEQDWRGFQTQLHRYVRRRVGEPAVEDVVGDILLRLVRHRDMLAAARNPAAWVRKVASNAIADHYRRQSTRDTGQQQYAADTAVGAEPQPDIGADGPDLTHCLRPIIARMDEPYRDAILRVDIEGQSQIEAAKALGLSVSGMKSRVQRGRAQLKELLVKHCLPERACSDDPGCCTQAA